jgi:monoamine oxidase
MPRRATPIARRLKGAKSAAPGSHRAPINPRSCIIIGAGLAGLSAAYILTRQKKPWDVTVLEAEEFSGGRVFSHSFEEAPKLVCELGGEWIGKDHKTARRLCKKLGLKLIPHRFDFFFFENGIRGKQFRAGESPFDKTTRAKFNGLMRQARHWEAKGALEKQKELDRKDWWTVLRDIGFEEKDLLRRDLMDSTDFGESIRQTGGYSAASEYSDSDPFDEMDWKIKGGNKRLVEGLEKAIWARGGRVLNSHQVAAIEQPDSPPRVIVTTTRDETFSALYCICTVPARTLTTLKFKPRLDQNQRDAAEQLQYCRIMKTVILCDTRFWMENKKTRFSCFTDRTADFLFDATLGQPGTKGILCSYSIGDKADDLFAYEHKDLIALLEEDFKALFPGKPIRILNILKQAWQSHKDSKFTQGAYAFYRPGQWFAVRKVLATPFKNILFAGEHIADEQGFMDGAIDTGQEAARKLIRHVKRPASKLK